MTGKPLMIRVVGIPWYARADYTAIRRIMGDGANLPDTWRQWRRLAEKAEKEIQHQGGVALRVHLDPQAFPIWCALRGLNVDAAARLRFVNEAAGRHGHSH